MSEHLRSPLRSAFDRHSIAPAIPPSIGFDPPCDRPLLDPPIPPYDRRCRSLGLGAAPALRSGRKKGSQREEGKPSPGAGLFISATKASRNRGLPTRPRRGVPRDDPGHARQPEIGGT